MIGQLLWSHLATFYEQTVLFLKRTVEPGKGGLRPVGLGTTAVALHDIPGYLYFVANIADVRRLKSQRQTPAGKRRVLPPTECVRITDAAP